MKQPPRPVGTCVTWKGRLLVHRTPFGTRIEWRRGAGLLVRDPAGACRPLPPAELRRCYPEAWAAWVRLASLLPDRGLEPPSFVA